MNDQIKINSNQFFSLEELKRLLKILEEKDKLIIDLLDSLGVITSTRNTDALEVNNTGANEGFININAGKIIDKDYKIGVLEEDSNNALEIPINTTSGKIICYHEYTNREVGTCSIDANGIVTGVGTKFTEVIRDVTNNVVKIEFERDDGGTLLNTLEYNVLELIDDTKMEIQGTGFSVETNLKLVVIGSFEDGISIPESSKIIYSYNSIKFELKASDYSLLSEKEFLLATVTRGTDSVITITDKRSDNTATTT